MTGTLGIEVGSYWRVGHSRYGQVRRVDEIGPHPDRGPGLFARCPRVGLNPDTGKPYREHWTDWMPIKTLANLSEPISGGVEEAEAAAAKSPTHRTLADAIEADMPKQRKNPMTPKRRAQNKVTSLRYKIKHPEKHGRTKWSRVETQELEGELAHAEEKLEELR